MKRKRFFWVSGLALSALVVLGLLATRSSSDEATRFAVERGPLTRWVSYQGILEARKVDILASELSGAGVVEFLAPEGAPVEAGDVLVRFDRSHLERDLLRLERDDRLAKAELSSLENAELPLKRKDLELQLLETRAEYAAEQAYLEESVLLMQEGLVSEPEVEKQRLLVKRLHSRLSQMEQQVDLTTTYLHPARLAQARATLEAAEMSLALARREIDNCILRAPSTGIVSYRPLHIGGDYRIVRVGDTLFKNQPFVAIPDMREVVVECYVPEGELALIGAEAEVLVIPIAYPTLTLRGSVQTVGTVAQMIPGRSAAQKYFRVVVDVQDADSRLRSGMSVIVRILVFHDPDALLIPRTALQWRDGEPFVEVQQEGRWHRRPLTAERSSDTHVEAPADFQEGLALRRP